MLQLRHAYKFMFAKFVSTAFIWLGKAGITVSSVISCHYVMKDVFKDFEDHLDQDVPDPKITDETASLVVVGVFSYMIASIFLGLLENAVLSLLTNVALDMDKNGGMIRKGPPTFHSGQRIDTI